MIAASVPIMPSVPAQEVEGVNEWITKAFGRAQVASLCLGQRRREDGAVSAISSWANEDFDQFDGPDGIARAIVGEALRDAETLRGTIRFVVEAFKPGESTAFTKHSFRLDGTAGAHLMPAIVAVIGDRLTEERVHAIAEKLSGDDRTEFLEAVRLREEARRDKLTQIETYRAIFDAFEFTADDIKQIACELDEPIDSEFQAAAEHFGKSQKSQ